MASGNERDGARCAPSATLTRRFRGALSQKERADWHLRPDWIPGYAGFAFSMSSLLTPARGQCRFILGSAPIAQTSSTAVIVFARL